MTTISNITAEKSPSITNIQAPHFEVIEDCFPVLSYPHVHSNFEVSPLDRRLNDFRQLQRQNTHRFELTFPVMYNGGWGDYETWYRRSSSEGKRADVHSHRGPRCISRRKSPCLVPISSILQLRYMVATTILVSLVSIFLHNGG